LHDTERDSILRALESTAWNRRKAANLLGIGYSTLRRKIQDYALEACQPTQNEHMLPFGCSK
ncbi:hypothetical protein HQ520_09635, partial [bacterium]|nr:hypothetical protein [bacterium]